MDRDSEIFVAHSDRVAQNISVKVVATGFASRLDRVIVRLRRRGSVRRKNSRRRELDVWRRVLINDDVEKALSSSGLGHGPFTAATRVRIPSGSIDLLGVGNPEISRGFFVFQAVFFGHPF